MSAPPQASRRRGALRMLGGFARRYPGRTAAALLLVFIASLSEVFGMSMVLSMLMVATGGGDTGAAPSFLQQVATKAAGFVGLDPTRPEQLVLLAIPLIALRGVLTLLANRQVGYTVARIATDLRLSLIRATMGARWRHYLDQSVGGLSNAIATEAQRASQTFQLGAEMAAMVLSSIVYLCAAFSISPGAGLGAVVAGAVLLTTMRVLIRKAGRAGQRQTALQKSLLTLVGAQFAAAKPLKAMAREDHVDALLTDETRDLERALRRQVISKGALTALQEPLLAILVIIGFFLGVTVAKEPLAEVVVMLFMLARVGNYLNKGQRAYQQVAIDESAYWSLMQAIDDAHAQRESPGGGRAVRLSQRVELERVRYAHDGTKTLLDEASLVIPSPGLTLVIGASGAGKTTLLDLIVGLRDPDAGRILVDGVPLPELDLRAWRRQIGYVPQESVMVDESVAHNLALGEDIPEEHLREALRAAGALGFVEAMPQGLATRVGPGGSRLSGGQRQRLAIARALVHAPRLLILDEATSNLDPEAQEAIVETIAHLKTRMAVLAVSHQDRLVEVADRVLRLADGRLSALSLVEARAALGG